MALHTSYNFGFGHDRAGSRVGWRMDEKWRGSGAIFWLPAQFSSLGGRTLGQIVSESKEERKSVQRPIEWCPSSLNSMNIQRVNQCRRAVIFP